MFSTLSPTLDGAVVKGRQRTYLRIFLLSSLHVSNLCRATRFSEMRSCSRLMLCRAFNKSVVAMDASAIVTYICSFSASRLKGLDFRTFLSLSFCFFLSLDGLMKLNDSTRPVTCVPGGACIDDDAEGGD